MEKIIAFLNQAHQQKKKIVLVTGVFDLIHQEHREFLRKAKAAGDVLIVGLEADVRVQELKGDERPINDQNKRQQQLQNLSVVDLAFVLPEDFCTKQERLDFLKLVKPDVLAVSSHTSFLKEKKELMGEIGGEVQVVHEFNPDISTTKLISENKL